MTNLKVYVDVNARFSKEGDLIPRSFIWEDGKTYEIDKVKKKERCASRKAGGTGIMYTCIVGGKECHLYFEVDKFFMEKNRIADKKHLSAKVDFPFFFRWI